MKSVEKKEAPKIVTDYKLKHDSYPHITADVIKNVYIHHEPTSNCQVFSIGGMNQLLMLFPNDEDVFKEMNTIANTVFKERCLIDISKSFEIRVDKLFVDKVIFKQPYESSNGSEMIIYMLDMSDWFHNDENDDWFYNEDDDE